MINFSREKNHYLFLKSIDKMFWVKKDFLNFLHFKFKFIFFTAAGNREIL